MSKLLWNPTNEELSHQYSGVTYFFAPGEKKKVPDNCGAHLLHNLDARGLTVLELDENGKVDEEKIKVDALARNKAFKMRTVSDFNQRNEGRKQQGMSYLSPTEKIKEYAIELGLGLLELFTVKDVEREAAAKDRDETKRLREENELLKTNLNDLISEFRSQGERISELTALVAPPEFGDARPRTVPVKQKGA
jgi:hypothetical protein